jgi:tetratricopeptide (TPR) repeat protein
MLGETHLRMGRTDEAIRGCLEPCIELRKSVVPSDPANAEQQDREMSACEAKLGQAQLIAGRAEDALRRLVAATQSRMHHNKLHPELITDVGQRELAEWYASLGDANFSLGQKNEAAAAYESSIKVLDDFEAIQPQSAVARQGLASIYRRFSRQLSENGDQEQADRMNRFALAAAGSNAATMVASIGDPTMGAKSLNTDSDVSPGLFAGGGVFSPEREQAELNRTEVELEKRRRLLLAKGASRDALVNLAGAYSSLAASFNKAKLPDSGLRVSDQGIAIFRSVILRDSADSTMQMELARSLIQQCDTFILLERQDAAERVLKESQSLLQQLSTQDPLNQRLAYELLTLERRFGQIERLRGEHDRAKARYQKATLDLKSYIDRKLFVAAATQELKLLNRAAKFNAECQVALSNWDELLTQPAELLPKLLSLRCTALRNGSDTTAVEQAAAKLAALEPPAAINHISSACGYGICLKILDRQTPSEELVKRRAALMQQALQQVKLGLQAGWTDLSYLKEEPDFAAFRDSEEFQNLLKEAAKPAAP